MLSKKTNEAMKSFTSRNSLTFVAVNRGLKRT